MATVVCCSAGGEDGRFVDEVGEVCAAEPGGLARQAFEAYLVGEGLALGVDVEDGDASVDVRQVEDDAPVEASGSEEGGVEDVGAVGGGDDDDVGGGVEAVHLDENLVEGLLTLVVAAAEAGAAMASDGVDLVYEDDGGSVALRLVEKVTYAGRADADEHLDELRA